MNNEKKIKPVLNGTAETMLQCFYAYNGYRPIRKGSVLRHPVR